jgi:hypothetical protein
MEERTQTKWPVKIPKPLKLTITIPGPFVALFEAQVMVNSAGNRESFAARAICRWLLSEDAMQAFDGLVNSLTA